MTDAPTTGDSDTVATPQRTVKYSDHTVMPLTDVARFHQRRIPMRHLSSHPLVAVLVLVPLAGCATYSQVMINPLGQAMMCQASGRGLVAAEQAQSMQDRCLASLRAAGYVEIERAGVIGIIVSDSLDIIRVVPGSPADSVGVRPGDHIEHIDGQPVRDRTTITVLLFGAPGTAVRLGLVRAGQPLEVVAIRKPYPTIHGVPREPREPARL